MNNLSKEDIEFIKYYEDGSLEGDFNVSEEMVRNRAVFLNMIVQPSKGIQYT